RASARQTRVRESLQHPEAILLQERLQLLLELLFRQRTKDPLANGPVAADENRRRQTEDRTVRLFGFVGHLHERIVRAIRRGELAQLLGRVVGRDPDDLESLLVVLLADLNELGNLLQARRAP